MGESHRVRWRRELRARRRAERVEMDGHLVATGAPEHGVAETYREWGCRCAPCCTANTVCRRQERGRRAEPGVVRRRTTGTVQSGCSWSDDDWRLARWAASRCVSAGADGAVLREVLGMIGLL